jgi:hypothetical protein
MRFLFSFTRRSFSCAMVFLLFACGGGGGGDNDSNSGATNNGVAIANRSVPDNVFIAALIPAQEISAVTSTATGIGIVLIDPSTRLMRASLTTAGIVAPSAHIRRVEAGSSGSITLSLTETPTGSGVWSAQATLTEDQLTALRNGDFYFNANSAAFPEGEIRGQIVQELPANGIANNLGLTPLGTKGVNNGGFTIGNAAIANPGNPLVPGSTTGTTIDPAGFEPTGTNTATGTTTVPGSVTQRIALINMMTGMQQVPSNSSIAVAIGVVIVDTTSGGMVASITSMGISGLSSHIHQAGPGANGAAIFALNETTNGSGIWSVRLALTETQRNEFTNGNYYFDIHTAAFPDGELRGQIAASSDAGNFNVGSAPGFATENPFVPGSVTGSDNTGNSVTGSTGTGAGVPSFGNPVGSGIGSASSGDSSVTSIPTFGNPAGIGIGSGMAF